MRIGYTRVKKPLDDEADNLNVSFSEMIHDLIEADPQGPYYAKEISAQLIRFNEALIEVLYKKQILSVNDIITIAQSFDSIDTTKPFKVHL